MTRWFFALTVIAFGLTAVPAFAQETAADALVAKAETALYAGDFATARGFADEAVKTDPYSIDALMARAALHLKEGEPVDALKLLKIADGIEQDNADVLAGMARGYMDIRLTQKARRLLERALELAPAGVHPLYVRALLNRRVGLEDDAIHDYSRVIALEPRFVDAYIERSELYKAQGLSDLAKADMKSALDILESVPFPTEE